MHVEEFMKRVDNNFLENEYHIGSLHTNSENSKNLSEYDESIDADNLSCDYEENDSRFDESR